MFRIRFRKKDQVRGNYVLMRSGPVRHIASDGKHHDYFVTIDQIEVLHVAGIDPIIIPPTDTSGLIDTKNGLI